MFSNSVTLIILLILSLHKDVFCDKLDSLRQKSFPVCKACRIYIDSFNKGMKRTFNGKFEGGDAAWEEEKLGSYALSEVRLTEIQEKVCSDVEEGKDQCYSSSEQHDELLEEWWFNHQISKPNLFEYICVDILKVCCLDLHYGPDCVQCSGYPDNVCNNNGRCKGAGTRKGNGECACNTGYIGESCDRCASTFYEDYRDNKKLLCSKCHTACADECNTGGASGCLNCTSGWMMEATKGCIDINECISDKRVCKPSQFCINSEGSYKCLECDSSCYECTGDGPDMCISCARGYTKIDNICIDNSSQQRKQHAFLMRYLTYLGLTIATCIIFQRNMTIAALVGTCVAAYIAVSEYMLNSEPSTFENVVQHIPNNV